MPESGPHDPSPPLGGVPRLPAPGALVAGCVIEGELGRGAMGAVFRARDPEGRAVALKVMLSQGSSKQRLERFRREVELTQGLSHPGIVRVLGAGVEGELPCLILELVEGTDLEELFQDPGTDPDTKLRLVEEVARAVDYAHGQGVVHRDLKPANVLVSQDGRARVTDFGLARELDRKTRLTVTGQGLGTPAYMSPEQVMGDKNTGPGVDVYALGVMLFEALTGELPFDASTPMALYDSILKTKAPRPSSLSPQVARYDRLVESALAKDPARRLSSAGALARELEALRLGLGPQRGGPWPWLALAGLLLGALGLAWGAHRSEEPPRATLPTTTPGPLASGASSPSPSPTPEQQTQREASSLLEQGEPEEALRLLRRKGQGEGPLARRLSLHLAACERAREALDKMESYTTRDYAEVPAWLEAAEGALEEAGPDLERSPRALLLSARLADYRLNREAVSAAIQELLRLPSANRRDETYQGLLLLAEWAGAVNKGPVQRQLLERAAKLRPDRAEARFALVFHQPRVKPGQPDPVEALARDFPHHLGVLNLQAAELFRAAKALPKGSPEQARGLKRAEIKLRRAIANSEAPVDMLLGLGYLLAASGRRADGDAAQARALRLSRERGVAAYWYRQGHLARRRYETQKDPEAFKLARAALLRAKARAPESPAVLGELAILRWVLGPRTPRKEGYRGVRKQLQAAVKHCRVDWETNFYLGHTLRYSPQHQDAAIRAFDRAIALKPGHPWNHLGRGMAYLGQGKHDLAIKDARRALELKPGWKSAKDLLEKAQR